MLPPNWFSRNGCFGCVERVTRVHLVVAEELEDAAVKLVGAGLRHEVDLAARAAAGLRRIQRRVDAELGDRIGADHEPQSGFLPRVFDAGGVQPVESPVVVVARPADEADGLLAAVAGVDRAGREAIRLAQWRPFSGISRISREPITAPITGDSVSSVAAVPSTVTVVSVPLTSSCTFKVRLSPTPKCTSLVVTVRIPG